MSIVTLKRKTQAQYNNVSVGQSGFSLNGTRRSSGYVGQDTLGRSLVRSLSRNGALKGHGGCCGKFPINEIKTSPEMACLNNSAVVKPSSLSTNGMLMTKYRWIRRPQPFSTTKADYTQNNNTQSDYIDYIAVNAIEEGLKCHVVSDHIVKTCPRQCPPISKPDSSTGAISSDEHIRIKRKTCKSKSSFAILKTIRSLPFACGTPNNFVPLMP